MKPQKEINHSKQLRHYFWLNPYNEMAFTRCPKCENKTKVRKIYLVIDYKQSNLIFLNKECKYCTYCDLIIAKKSELEYFFRQIFESNILNFDFDDFFIFGTTDRKDWLQSQNETIPSSEAIKLVYPFKDIFNFRIRPAGWYREG